MSASKVTYAQSSDIKSRTFLEYRRDMKKKAIAELEFLPFLGQLLAPARVEKQRGERRPHTDRKFFYVLKPLAQYAFVEPAWVMQHGKEGAVPAWGSRPAYRVPVADLHGRAQQDGSFADSGQGAQAEATRCFLFAANLLEDMWQDFAVAYGGIERIEKIFDILPDYAKTAAFVRSSLTLG